MAMVAVKARTPETDNTKFLFMIWPFPIRSEGLIELPQLLRGRFRGKRDPGAILGHELLAFTAEDEAQEFLDPRRQRFPGRTIDVEPGRVGHGVGVVVDALCAGH